MKSLMVLVVVCAVRLAIADDDCPKPVDTGQPAKELLRAQTAYLQCLLQKKGLANGGVCVGITDAGLYADLVLNDIRLEDSLPPNLDIKPADNPIDLLNQLVFLAHELEFLDPASDKLDAVLAFQIASWMKRWMVDDPRRSLRAMVGCP